FEKSLKPGERFTFEYVMLKDVNDSDEQARQLANLLNRHSLRAKVNLIPHNPAEPLPYQPSTVQRVERCPRIRAKTAGSRHLSCLRTARRAWQLAGFASAATAIESSAIQGSYEE